MCTGATRALAPASRVSLLRALVVTCVSALSDAQAASIVANTWRRLGFLSTPFSRRRRCRMPFVGFGLTWGSRLLFDGRVCRRLRTCDFRLLIRRVTRRNIRWRMFRRRICGLHHLRRFTEHRSRSVEATKGSVALGAFVHHVGEGEQLETVRVLSFKIHNIAFVKDLNLEHFRHRIVVFVFISS